MMNKSRINIYIISILVIFLPVVFFSSYKVYSNFEGFRSRMAQTERRRQAWLNLGNRLQYKVNNFRGEVGIIIKDMDTGWEITFNKDKLMPSASLVKLPILLSYFYAAQEGKVDLSSVQKWFDPMITHSDNNAANLLINRMGFSALNAYFKKLGLKNTNLSRRMLDFKQRCEGVENYTTVSDMAYLLEELYRKDFLTKDISQRCLELLVQQKINDRLPKKLPKRVIVAHKTGLERHVCHDVGIIFTDKGDFLVCVLVRHDDRLAWSAKRFISEVALLTYRYCQALN